MPYYVDAKVIDVRELPARRTDAGEITELGGERIVRHNLSRVLAVR